MSKIHFNQHLTHPSKEQRFAGYPTYDTGYLEEVKCKMGYPIISLKYPDFR